MTQLGRIQSKPKFGNKIIDSVSNTREQVAAAYHALQNVKSLTIVARDAPVSFARQHWLILLALDLRL
jgi:hypothetical protein